MSDREAIFSLLERVRAATEGCYDLDCAVHQTAFYPQTLDDPGQTAALCVNLEYRPPPKYTSSLDAIVALIEQELPGWNYDLHSPRMGQVWEAVISERKESRVVCVGHAPTAPLALCVAFLSASLRQA